MNRIILQFILSLLIITPMQLLANDVVTIDAIVEPCVNTTWLPNADTVCSSSSLTQTSNCGMSRIVNGSKNCNTAGGKGGSGGGGGGGGAAPTPTLVPPTVLDLKVASLLSNKAVISWQTNKSVKTELNFGKTDNFELDTLKNNNSQNFGRFELLSLRPSTRYFYRIIFTDQDGAQSISYSFLETSKEKKLVNDEEKNINEDKIENKNIEDVCPRSADINRDGQVELIDFSILFYNFNTFKNKMADLLFSVPIIKHDRKVS